MAVVDAVWRCQPWGMSMCARFFVGVSVDAGCDLNSNVLVRVNMRVRVRVWGALEVSQGESSMSAACCMQQGLRAGTNLNHQC